MNQEKRGFIAPIITPDNHVLGSVGIPLPVISIGDYTNFLPIFKSQFENNFDSDGCTCYGTTNSIKTLDSFHYSINPDYSNRYVYNGVGITPPGSDPHTVATTIRGIGLVDDKELPDNVPSLSEFMTPRPLTSSLQAKGQQWLQKRQLGHQWLWTTPPDQATRLALIKEALTKGTVAVSVSAWWQNEKGLYYSPMGTQNGHWVHIYKIDETGIYAFDSYEGNNPSGPQSYLKKLTLDHNIQFAKVYFFTVPTQQQNLLSRIIAALLALVGIKQKQLEQIPAVITPPTPVATSEPVLAPKSRIDDFCLEIRDYEGKPGDLNYKNNNPGNLRGTNGKFLIFKTYNEGWLALKDYVIRACTGKHAAYKPDFTILQFFQVYAPSADNNDPKRYASWVANRIGVTTDFKIKDLV